MAVRRRRLLLSMVLVGSLAGCDVPLIGGAASRSDGDVSVTVGGQPGAEAARTDGGTWVVEKRGRPQASPTRPAATPSTSASPSAAPASAEPEDPYCAFAWSAGQVIIPVEAETARGAVTVVWPRTGNPPPAQYRVAAVPQTLVAGEQPPVVWRTVRAQSGCRNTTTITGLTSGEPYVIWLDAPESGYQPDGTPRPTHGRSGVVRPD